MVWRHFWLYCGEPHSMPCRLSETTMAIFVRSIREFRSGDCAPNLCQLMVTFRLLSVRLVITVCHKKMWAMICPCRTSCSSNKYLWYLIDRICFVFQCSRNSELAYDIYYRIRLDHIWPKKKKMRPSFWHGLSVGNHIIKHSHLTDSYVSVTAKIKRQELSPYFVPRGCIVQAPSRWN